MLLFRKLKLLLLFCSVLFIGPLNGTAQNFSSDISAVEAMKEDTSKASALIKLYDAYYTRSDDSIPAGLKHILDAYYIDVKFKYQKGIIESSYRIGANMLTFKNTAKATDFYFIALTNAEEAGDKLMEGKSLMGLGLVFYNQKKWNDALAYFGRSVGIFDTINEKRPLSVVMYLEGLCYNELKQYAKAKENLEGALALAEARGDSAQIYECTLGLAKVDYGLMNYDAALSKYDMTKKFYEERSEKLPLALIHEGKADVYLAQNSLEKALMESDTAYTIARSSATNINLVEITSLLYTIYDRMGNKEKAFRYLLENSHIKDSLNSQDISEKIAIASTNYAFEKKEQKYNEEMEKSNRRKNFAIYFSIFLAGFMLLGFLSYQTLRKERKKSEELLLNILPFETKEELKKFGKAIPKMHPSTTIMFCDAVGFTKISSTMSPETLVNMIDFYFSKFDEIITSNGLEKIKTIGDSYMSAGGLHQTDINSEHAVCTINAAIEIMRFTHDVEKEMTAKYGSYFRFRIGIHSGNVVSGVVGSKKYAYDIWGDTVNVAARMEQYSEAGQINVSGDTYNLVKGKYTIDYRGKINAKHKGELDMYFIPWDQTKEII